MFTFVFGICFWKLWRGLSVGGSGRLLFLSSVVFCFHGPIRSARSCWTWMQWNICRWCEFTQGPCNVFVGTLASFLPLSSFSSPFVVDGDHVWRKYIRAERHLSEFTFSRISILRPRVTPNNKEIVSVHAFQFYKRKFGFWKNINELRSRSKEGKQFHNLKALELVHALEWMWSFSCQLANSTIGVAEKKFSGRVGHGQKQEKATIATHKSWH